MLRYWTIFAAAAFGLAATPSQAQTASSSGYAVGANQQVRVGQTVTATVDVGPLAATSGAAPPSYNQTNTVVSASETAALTSGLLGVQQSLNTGLLTSTSSGTATGAQATATVNNLSFGLGTDRFLASLLGLSATTIQSSSQANSVGGLDASGSTTIEGLLLNGSIFGGIVINGSLFVNPAPNTVLFNSLGLSIILNEQILSGDGITSTGITTNAIRIGFDNFLLGTGLVDGNVIIGQSQARATAAPVAAAVPEPGTWAMMLLGFGLIGGLMRRRRAERLALATA